MAPTNSSEAAWTLTGLGTTLRRMRARLGALRMQSPARVAKPAQKTKPADEKLRAGHAIRALHVVAEETVPSGVSVTTEAHRQDRKPSPTHKHKKLTMQDFKLGRHLGEGGFGIVHLAQHIPSGFICAIKIIPKVDCQGEQDEELIQREINIHRNLEHKNILKMYSWFHDEKSVFLVLEFAPGGDLFTRLKRQPNSRFNERKAAHYIAQTADALRYMHRKNIMHRDIKPENILLGLHGEVKLADFGYSVHTDTGFRSTMCGTTGYLSPEVANMFINSSTSQEQYTKAVDNWSLGMLTYELLVGKLAFAAKTFEKTREKIARYNGARLGFPWHLSEQARDFIRKLLELEAERRMSLDDVLVHPWLVQNLGEI